MAAGWRKLLYSDDTSGLGITRITNLYDDFIGSAGNLTMTGTDNFGFGYQALHFNTTGINNIAIGFGSLYTNTEGNSNIAIGDLALYHNTEGVSNVAIGENALIANTLGTDNISIGDSALNHNTEGNYNLAFGTLALSVNLTGFNNVAIGRASLYTNSTGSGNVAIGDSAGKYELGSDAFYVNNQDRTNTAGDKTKSLLYGTFNATAASQTLTVNGQLINNNVLISGGAITGITDLAVADGGTGVSTLSSGSLIWGQGTSPVGNTTDLTWDNTTKILIVKGGIDSSLNTFSVANNGTVNFANMSGMIMANNYTTGEITTYLCGGAVTGVMGKIGTQVGTLAYNAGINGYTWTNTYGSTATFSFFVVHTRANA